MLSSVSTSYTDEQVVGATSYTYLITASTSAGEGPGASDMVTTPAGGKYMYMYVYVHVHVCAIVHLKLAIYTMNLLCPCLTPWCLDHFTMF